MTVWRFPVLCVVSVLGGMKSVCGWKLWVGEDIALSGVWAEKQTYRLAGFWMMLYGLLWFASGKSAAFIRLVDLLCTYGILAAVDGKRRIVPDSILLCYFLDQMLLGALSMPAGRLLYIFLTGGIFTAAICGFSWLSKGKMGMGDARLLGVTAMTAGWEFGLQMLILAVMISFVYSIGLLVFFKKSVRTEFPFVPFLAAGIVVSIVF